MKGIFVFIFIFLFNPAYGLECDGIKRDILALEYRILNSTEKNCESCKTKGELTQEYNKILAELVIAEGIASLNLSIQEHHNALNDLSTKDLNKALDGIYELNDSLNGSALIHQGLNFEDGTSIFSRYDGASANELKEYLQIECNQGKFSDFCSMYQPNNENHINMLSGFLLSDRQLGNSDNERRVRYQQYQRRLRIKKADGSLISPQEFKTDNYMILVDQLKDLLANLKTQRSQNQDTEQIVKDILAKSKEIKDIEVSTTQGSTANENVTDFIKDKIDKVINSFDTPDILLQGNVSKNLFNTQLRIDNDIKAKEKSFEKKIKNYLSKRDTKSLNGRPLSQACNNNYGLSCLEIICGVNGSTRPSTCENFRDINFNKEYQEYKKIKALQDQNKNLAEAQSCFSKSKLEDQRSCLESFRSNSTPIGQLREQLKNKKNELRSQSRKSPFPELNQQKALAIKKLNSNYCRKNYDIWKFNSPKVDCVQSSGIDQGLEALNLGIQGENIMINLEENIVKTSIDGLLNKNQIKLAEQELKLACNNGTTVLTNLCKHYKDEETFKKSWQDMIDARNNVVIIDTGPKVDTSPKWGQALEYAAKSSLLPNLTGLIYSYGSLDLTRDQTRYQIRSINAFDEWYMKNLEAYREQQELPLTQPYAYNFGYMGNTSNAISNFQNTSAQNGTLFGNSSPFNYSFTPIQPLRIESGVSSNNGSFSFQF